MASVTHLVAAVGLQGQIGLQGTIPWIDYPSMLNQVSESTKYIMEQAKNGLWICGPKTLPTLHSLKTAYSLPAQLCLHMPEDDPDFTLQSAAATFPDSDIWIMGGASVFKAFMPYVDQFHITVVPYDGYADRYLEPVIPGWVRDEKQIRRLL